MSIIPQSNLFARYTVETAMQVFPPSFVEWKANKEKLKMKKKEFKYHSEQDVPKEGEIFVFGSNLAGVHGAGAALHAREHYGAVLGEGRGRHGQSYAIPTKDFKIKTLPIDSISGYVKEFIFYALRNPEEAFYVTRVGCGLAGYTDEDIAPLFSSAPTNCILPIGWKHLV